MRVLFYSKTCDFCMKLIEYINKNILNEYFNMICIDEDTTKIPKNITVVPTIIDEEIEVLKKSLKQDEKKYEAKVKDWLRISHFQSY